MARYENEYEITIRVAVNADTMAQAIEVACDAFNVEEEDIVKVEILEDDDDEE